MVWMTRGFQLGAFHFWFESFFVLRKKNCFFFFACVFICELIYLFDLCLYNSESANEENQEAVAVHTEREREVQLDNDCHMLRLPVNMVMEVLVHNQLFHAAEQTLLVHHDRSLWNLYILICVIWVFVCNIVLCE